MKMLITIGGYYPAKNYGGPVVSIENFTNLLGDDIDFNIITSNVEFKTNEKLSNIHDGWNDVFKAKVLYLNKKDFNYKKFNEIVIDQKPDIIYVNSFFSYDILLPFIKISKKQNIPLLLAPRGELCKNALNMKKTKKMAYILVVKRLLKKCRLFFHSTSEEETDAICKLLDIPKNHIFQLSNIPTIYDEEIVKGKKEKGHLKAVFTSRIHPKKNLLFLIECLKKVKGNVSLDIYGPIEDEDYWNKVLEVTKKLPDGISVKYCGNLEHEKIIPTLSKYEAFLFYTLSENYGHVIAEAVNALCIPVISNTTPWNDLEDYNAGFVSSLQDENECIKNIQNIVDLDNEEYHAIVGNLLEYKQKILSVNDVKKNYAEMLEKIDYGKN